MTTGLGNRMEHALLTADQEKELAKAIERGRAAEAKLAGASPPAGGRELAKLQTTIAAGRAARETFVTSNFRLVAKVARRFQIVREGGEDIATEVFQDGVEGLCRAVDSFDWRRDLKFSTYAVWWIRKYMTKGMARRGSGAPSESSTQALENRGKLSKAQEELYARYHREPTNQELAEELGMSPVTIGNWLLPRPASIEELHLKGDRFELSVGAEGDDVERVAHDELSAAVAKVLATLAPDVRRVVELKFGIGGQEPMTNEMAAEKMGITPTRVRNLWVAARRALSSSLADLSGTAAAQSTQLELELMPA